jgi:ABC-type Fe3+/spermidine/putrescine transport system ATPase subunit
MLEIEALTARVGAFRLTGINLAVGAGECHTVLGPSGAGKSTLLHAVLGTLPVESGRIRLAGAEITRLPVERRHLGYVPQQLGLFPHLSVHDNLTYSARARKVPRGEFEPLLKHLTDITGIGALLDRFPATLSGGERQRVALVRALASNPRLVLLDEPFTALNESLRRELWWLVKDLQRERELSVLLVTHDLTEAYFLAKHVTVLIDGQQEQSGSREEVYRRPATLAVARFLGLKNLFAAEVTCSTHDGVEAWCPMLGHRFRLSGYVVAGTPIRLGIRPENVVLRDAAHPPRPGECVLTGRVRLTDLDADVAIQFLPDGLAVPIELVASRRVATRFRLADGQEGVTIGLPEAEMFWLRDT